MHDSFVLNNYAGFNSFSSRISIDNTEPSREVGSLCLESLRTIETIEKVDIADG